MQELARLSRAIELAADLRVVVRTLETLAAASARRFEQALEVTDEHVAAIESGLSVALAGADALPGADAPGRPWGLVALGSDHGLCGGFNAPVEALARRFREGGDPPARVLVMGARLASVFVAEGWRVDRVIRVPSTPDTVARAVDAILLEMDAWRRSGIAMTAVAGHHAGAPARGPTTERLWPPDPAVLARRLGHPWPTRNLPEVVGPPAVVLGDHLQAYVAARADRWVVHSVAAEHQARLAAMRAAGRNIDERAEALRARWRQVRQETITLELLDVVAGWKAVRHSTHQAPEVGGFALSTGATALREANDESVDPVCPSGDRGIPM